MNYKHILIYVAGFLLLCFVIRYFHEQDKLEQSEAWVNHYKKEVDSLHEKNIILKTKIDSLATLADRLKKKRTQIKSDYEKKYMEVDTIGSGELINHFGRVFTKNNIR